MEYHLFYKQWIKTQGEAERWRKTEFQASGTKEQMLGENKQLRMRLGRTGRQSSLYFPGFCLCFWRVSELSADAKVPHGKWFPFINNKCVAGPMKPSRFNKPRGALSRQKMCWTRFCKRCSQTDWVTWYYPKCVATNQYRAASCCTPGHFLCPDVCARLLTQVIGFCL